MGSAGQVGPQPASSYKVTERSGKMYQKAEGHGDALGKKRNKWQRQKGVVLQHCFQPT